LLKEFPRKNAIKHQIELQKQEEKYRKLAKKGRQECKIPSINPTLKTEDDPNVRLEGEQLSDQRLRERER